MTPRLRTESDDAIFDPHTLSDGSLINLRLLFELALKNSVLSSFSFSMFTFIHSLISVIRDSNVKSATGNSTVSRNTRIEFNIKLCNVCVNVILLNRINFNFKLKREWMGLSYQTLLPGNMCYLENFHIYKIKLNQTSTLQIYSLTRALSPGRPASSADVFAVMYCLEMDNLL